MQEGTAQSRERDVAVRPRWGAGSLKGWEPKAYEPSLTGRSCSSNIDA